MKTLINKSLLNILAIAILVFVTSSCGGSSSSESSTTTDTPTSSSSTPSTSSSSEVVKVEITGNDQMRFDKAELRVPAGSKVELTLKHSGTLDAKVMGHNVVILKQGVDTNAFGVAAISASATGYVPEGSTDVIAYTEVIGGGQSTTITFDAPAAGSYDFICSFPGHYGLMKGKFIVE